jgi:hypothetical protein
VNHFFGSNFPEKKAEEYSPQGRSMTFLASFWKRKRCHPCLLSFASLLAGSFLFIIISGYGRVCVLEMRIFAVIPAASFYYIFFPG